MRNLLLAGVTAFALFGSAAAPAQQVACVPGDLVRNLLKVEAERIAANLEILDQADEVARYIEVINEEPPAAGPAERLLILEHPQSRVAGVFLENKGTVCERYVIGPTLHLKAWTAARGMAI